MPPDDPGGLDPEYYADVLAYVLSLNGYPPGEADLPADPRVLREVRFGVQSAPTGPQGAVIR